MAYRKITDIRDTIGMRAVFYARVSTAEEEQLNAIELQIEENRGCIEDHGWKLVGEYIDRSKSGTMVKGRDDYQRLYEDLYEDLFDIVVIKDQERLQRNTLDWYLFINRVVQTGKLLFMYMDGKFYSPDDALITGVRAIIAEEFSRNLSKKLHNYHDHRIEKARQGQEIALQGSGNVYGWDKKDGKYGGCGVLYREKPKDRCGGQKGHSGPEGDGGKHGDRHSCRRKCAVGRGAGRGKDPVGPVFGPGFGSALRTDPVYTRSDARRCNRHPSA